jgi:hypothetical protein
MSTEQMRVDFEAALRKRWGKGCGGLETLTNGDYQRFTTQFGWVIWQAATLAERERCAKALLGIANADAGNPYKQALRVGVEAIRKGGTP